MKKQFKSESKKILDMMINSIYTNKEIFLRELISNASDAIDKLYYQSLTNNKVNVDKDKLAIELVVDRDKNTLTIKDNGIGMSKEELENNLGTIAKSGSLEFKENNKEQKDVNIIGQFGVGFYSAFMVSSKIEVLSKKAGEKEAYLWTSEGADGYTITPSNKEENGTNITLYLKEDTDSEKYSELLTEYRIRSIIKKYSDYIRYPIKMEVENNRLKDGSDSEYETYKEVVTLNSMVPLWNKEKSKISEEEYNNFYMDKFSDFQNPQKVIHYSVEGMSNYKCILFIPSHAPYDFYTKEYKKGLSLYTNGVLIMDKCESLLPDYFSFIKGVVDTDDLSLNISRETLQDDYKVKQIAKNIENKIIKELKNLMKEDFNTYKDIFKNFGAGIKYGIYSTYGAEKEKLQDLLIFYSAEKKDYITLKEYTEKMKKSQKEIYYACGENNDKIDSLPQVEQVKNKKYDILYLTEYVDEFALQALREFDGKKFTNVSDSNLDLNTKEEKEELEKLNNDNKEMLEAMKESLPEITKIEFTGKLTNHPVCLTTKGNISIEMEKVINAMPEGDKIHAETVLEINKNHEISKKLQELYKKDKEMLAKYTKILYSQARLIEGLPVENPTEISNLVVDIISKK